MLSLEARLAVALRARVGLLVLAVLSIPYAIAAGCIVMLTAVILLLRKGPSAPRKDETAPAPSRDQRCARYPVPRFLAAYTGVCVRRGPPRTA